MDDLDLISLLGDGGQGKVYRARKRSNPSVEYALKVMQCREQTQLDYALKEIKVLTQLRHEHIVSYIDFFLRLDGGPSLAPPPSKVSPAIQPTPTPLIHYNGVSVILAMEMCNEGTLADRIREAKNDFMTTGEHCISEARVLRWLRQSAHALMYMHDRGFLHRDMKPSNIFLHRDAVKVGDFGLATPQSKHGVTSHVGTPYYLAPELLLRQSYDEKVDVWGLGLAFLELTTLQERPINTEILESPSRVDSVIHDITYLGFSTVLATLIRDMLQRQPAHRPTPRAILERIHIDEPQPERFTVTPPSVDEPVAPPKATLGGTRTGSSNHARFPTSAPTSPNKPAATAPSAQFATAVSLCNMCQVYVASKCCLACNGEQYCDACDEVKHSNTLRNAHQRVAVQDAPAMVSPIAPPVHHNPVAIPPRPPAGRARSGSQEQPAGSGLPAVTARARPLAPPLNALDLADNGTSGSGSAPTSRGNSPDIDPLPRPPMVVARTPVVPKTVYVPSQRYCNIVQALADATTGTTIVVAAGSAYADAIVMKVPGVTLVSDGSGDSRCRLGDAHLVTVTISAPDCRLSNFIITQTLPPAEPNDRPFAVTISCAGPVTIDKCEVSSVGNCIGVHGDATEATISNCNLRDAKQAGVYVFNGARCTVANCTISRCEYAGVLLKKRAKALVSGCTIRDGQQSGIFCHESTGVFERNTIINSGACAVVLKAKADPVVRCNVIQNAGQTGVFCCDRSTGTVTENQISGSGKAGVIVKTAAHPTVTKNIITQGKDSGIFIFENGQGHIEENDVRGNAGVGVVVTTGGDPRVVRNRIQQNLGDGVWICSGGRGYFESNDLRGNVKGPKDFTPSDGIRWIMNREA